MTDHVGQKTRRGLSWNLAGAVMVNGTRLVVLVALGRMLTSTDFGIVAAAISVNTIVHSLRDIGIGQALIQRKQLEDGHLTTAFAVSMYLGIGLSTLLFAFAPLIGHLFHIVESANIIRALAIQFVLRNIGATSQMVCRREMKFRLVALVDSFSFMAGSIVSIVGAAMGAGPWALVAGYLVEEALATALYLYYEPPKVSLRIHTDRLRELLSFGVGQTVTQIANTVATYGDNVVVGKALGARMLGFYSRAYDLIRFPAIVFEALAASVLFPAFSRIQDDRANLALGLRRGTFANALLLFPASALLMALAPEAIRILIGPGWDEAVLPFQIFSVTIVLRTNQRLSMLVAQAAGRSSAVAIAAVIYMLSVVVGAVAAVQWGIPGVAVTTSLAILVISAECAYLAMSVSGLPLREMLGAYVPGLLLAVVVAALAWPAANALRSEHVQASIAFAVISAASILLCIGVVAVLLRAGRGDFAWLRDELSRLRLRRAR